MGESGCLVRSFSNPADISHEAKEVSFCEQKTELIKAVHFTLFT